MAIYTEERRGSFLRVPRSGEILRISQPPRAVHVPHSRPARRCVFLSYFGDRRRRNTETFFFVCHVGNAVCRSSFNRARRGGACCLSSGSRFGFLVSCAGGVVFLSRLRGKCGERVRGHSACVRSSPPDRAAFKRCRWGVKITQNMIGCCVVLFWRRFAL